MPKIGEICQYKINDREWRPLLVLNVPVPDVVNGNLFLDFHDDERGVFNTGIFMGSKIVHLRSVKKGLDVGEWRDIE